MKIRNYFLIAVGGAVLGAVTGFAWRALNDADQPDFRTPIETVEVVEGLEAGTQVVRAGQQKIYPGARVLPTEATR